MAQPHIITSMFIDHAAKICIFYIGCFVVFTIFVGGLGLLDIAEVNPRDYQLWESQEQIDVNKLDLLEKYVNEMEGKVVNTNYTEEAAVMDTSIPRQSRLLHRFYIMYRLRPLEEIE